MSEVSSFRLAYTRMYSSPDGVTHFGEEELAISMASPTAGFVIRDHAQLRGGELPDGFQESVPSMTVPLFHFDQ